jgi:hypothetical protein
MRAGCRTEPTAHEEELKNASRYLVVICQTDGRLGALANPRTIAPYQLAHRIVELMRPATKPDDPIAVIQGHFGNDRAHPS